MSREKILCDCGAELKTYEECKAGVCSACMELSTAKWGNDPETKEKE